jgi:hypothetical protein
MKPLLSSAAIAALAFALPLSANAADTSNAPIVLSNVSVQPQVTGTSRFAPGSISLEFRNTSAVPATRVTFEVDAWGSPVHRIEDVGTFAQGATIRHDFPNSSNVPGETVSVAAVTFADGTVWQNDDAAPHALRQAVSELDLR